MVVMKRGTNIALWCLTILLALAYLAAGVSKLAGAEMMVEGFRRWGYPDWFRLLIGALEIVGAVLLVYPRTACPGSAILGLIMVGAIVTHLTHGEKAMALVPLVMLILVSIVGYARRPAEMSWPSGAARA